MSRAWWHEGADAIVEGITQGIAQGEAFVEGVAPSQWPGGLAAEDEHDPVSAPSHYRSHPSGVECITVTEHMSFCIGNAVKYLWRADLKGDAIEDLRKARWYIERELARRDAQP